MSKVYTFGENTKVRGCNDHVIEPVNRPAPRETHRFYALTSAGPVGFRKTSDAKTRDGLRKVARKLASDTDPWFVGSRTVRGRKGRTVQLSASREAKSNHVNHTV